MCQNSAVALGNDRVTLVTECRFCGDLDGEHHGGCPRAISPLSRRIESDLLRALDRIEMDPLRGLTTVAPEAVSTDTLADDLSDQLIGERRESTAARDEAAERYTRWTTR